MDTDLYLIALVPPPPLREQVRALKWEMQRKFGAGHALKAPAHITLQGPFRLARDRRDELEATLRHVAGLQHPFMVTLKDFDHFSTRVVFIRIEDHTPVVTLEARLGAVLSATQLLPVRPRARPFHPHMTIATRDLGEVDFQAAWPLFRERNFNGSFTASSLYILKHNGDTWDIHTEYTFGK